MDIDDASNVTPAQRFRRRWCGEWPAYGASRLEVVLDAWCEANKRVLVARQGLMCGCAVGKCMCDEGAIR